MFPKQTGRDTRFSENFYLHTVLLKQRLLELSFPPPPVFFLHECTIRCFSPILTANANFIFLATKEYDLNLETPKDSKIKQDKNAI